MIEEDINSEQIEYDYKIWEKNTPFLYDQIQSSSLTWPSLSCQVLPQKGENLALGCQQYRILLGTQTSAQESEYAQVSKIKQPINDNSAAWRMAPTFNANQASNVLSKTDLKLETEFSYKTKDEPNKVRQLYKNPNVFLSLNKDIEVFNSSDKDSIMGEDVQIMGNEPSSKEVKDKKPVLTLKGANDIEGQGLDSSQVEPLVAGGYQDGIMRLWDIGKEGANCVEPLHEFPHFRDEQKKEIEAVRFHKKSTNLLASVGDNASVCLWDLRTSEMVIKREQGHEDFIQDVEFCEGEEHLMMTCAQDGTIYSWDLRNVKSIMHPFEGHTDCVNGLQMMPGSPSVFMSWSNDRRVLIWDISKIGKEQSEAEQEDGVPELAFIHGGHTSAIHDACWNPFEDWSVVSVSEDNICQLWTVAIPIWHEEEVLLANHDNVQDII